MVRVNCDLDTSDYFSQKDKIKAVSIKNAGTMVAGYLGTIIGNCAFIPCGTYLIICEEGEWEYEKKV
jgi:hypothetical protein